MTEINELKEEIEKLTDILEKDIEFRKAEIMQRAEFYKALAPIKDYLRILVDKYQEDEGIEKILIKE